MRARVGMGLKIEYLSDIDEVFGRVGYVPSKGAGWC